MYCIYCGSSLQEGAIFCSKCGKQQTGQENTNNIPQHSSPKIQFVAAKCTGCGASLSVDSDQQAAICPYCNTPYIVEKAIENYKISNQYIGTQINIQGVGADNLSLMAEGELNAGKYSAAESYANRALEVDPSNAKAWIVKIKAAGFDIVGDRSSEIASYIETAIDSGITEDEEKQVYCSVIKVSQNHINEATKLLKSNTERIEKQKRERRNPKDIAAMDSGYIAKTTQLINEAIEYRLLIPENQIKGNEDIKREITELVRIYMLYTAALEERHKLYESTVSQKAKERQRENIRKLSIENDISSATNDPVKPRLFKLFG